MAQAEEAQPDSLPQRGINDSVQGGNIVGDEREGSDICSGGEIAMDQCDRDVDDEKQTGTTAEEMSVLKGSPNSSKDEERMEPSSPKATTPATPDQTSGTFPPQDPGKAEIGQGEAGSPSSTSPPGRPPVVPQRGGSDADVASGSEAFQAMRRRWEQEAKHKTPGGVDPQWFLEYTPKKYGTDSPSPRVSPGSSKKLVKNEVDVALMKAALESSSIENIRVPHSVNIPNETMDVTVPTLQTDDPVVMPKPVFSKGDFSDVDVDRVSSEGRTKQDGNHEHFGGEDSLSTEVPPGKDPDAPHGAKSNVSDEHASSSVEGDRQGTSPRNAVNDEGYEGVISSGTFDVEKSGQDEGMSFQNKGIHAPQPLPDPPEHIQIRSQKHEKDDDQKAHAWPGDQGVVNYAEEEEEVGTQDSSVLDIHPDAEMIVLQEDTDMRPCPTELELDGEPEFMELFPDGWDDVDNSNEADADLDVKGTEEELVVTAQCSLDAEGYVTTETVAAPEPPETTESQADTSLSSIDFSIISDPTATETTAGLSRRSSQMPDIPEDATPLPDPEKVRNTGSIFSRSSLRAIVMKKWHSAFWVQYGDSSLLVFRSKSDFEDWLLNPYHAQRQRDYLVKVKFDFRDEMVNKKSGLRGFRMTETKLKTYERKGEPMHHFKLERWSDMGMSIVAAFASPIKEEVEALREVISICLESCPHNGCRAIDDLIM